MNVSEDHESSAISKSIRRPPNSNHNLAVHAATTRLTNDLENRFRRACNRVVEDKRQYESYERKGKGAARRGGAE